MFYSIPPVTRTLVGVNVAMFVAELLLGAVVTLKLALWPIQSAAFAGVAGFRPWQVLTYSFLHGGILHLAFNMFALYMFGSELERLWGPKRFLNLYLASVISAALAQLAFASLAAVEPYPAIGASGAYLGCCLPSPCTFRAGPWCCCFRPSRCRRGCS